MSQEPRDPHPRASDADRDAVGELLREAHAEGRLSADEFSERLDAALAARTHGDLEPLTSDLPAPRPARLPTGDETRAGGVEPHDHPHDPLDREKRQDLRAAWRLWATAVLLGRTLAERFPVRTGVS